MPKLIGMLAEARKGEEGEKRVSNPATCMHFADDLLLVGTTAAAIEEAMKKVCGQLVMAV